MTVLATIAAASWDLNAATVIALGVAGVGAYVNWRQMGPARRKIVTEASTSESARLRGELEAAWEAADRAHQREAELEADVAELRSIVDELRARVAELEAAA